MEDETTQELLEIARALKEEHGLKSEIIENIHTNGSIEDEEAVNKQEIEEDLNIKPEKDEN